jgi:hypothetical protein
LPGELNNDQRRETVNTGQRYQAWREVAGRAYGYRGSMVWATIKGNEYLVRSYYDDAGRRRQKSLGPRSTETEELKRRFDDDRLAARERLAEMDKVLARQAAVNRALGLGRVPQATAKIVRALDRKGLLGSGLRVVGTNAIYAYEAVAGVHVDASVTATNDIDLLFDARRNLHLLTADDADGRSLLEIIRSTDSSFTRSGRSYRAVNREGFMVDLIKPQRRKLASAEKASIAVDDLEAAEIGGLVWLENAPPFDAIAIDDRGFPLRLVVPDPRIFAAHKLWVSEQPDREPIKRKRDEAQALVVADLVREHMPHLPFARPELRMLPLPVLETLEARLPRTPA